ncbi:MAG TPA: putative PEP-binding protein, partial [Stenomitos sp.]
LEDKTFLWALKGGAQGVTPQILGIVPDLPLPISLSEGQARAQTLSLALSSAPQVAILEKEEADLEAEGVFEQVLARGIAASSGWAAGPVCVIKDYSQVVPSSLKGVILAVDSFEPIHLPWLKAAAGLICEKGGITSHGAIMARELGCPAVVGVADITQILATGQWVALRGDVGEIYACDAKDARAFVAPKQPPATALPQFPLATQLLVSCSQPSQLKALAKAKCDGVGLVRGEWLLWGQLEQFTDNTVDDFTQLQQSIAEDLVAMARTVAPRPLYYRSIDADALDRNWLNRTERMGTEQNPAIGTRGILRYQANAAQFDAELRLLKGLLDQGICNLRLILPFVRSPEEVVFCSQRMQAMGLDPEHELPLWMMAEVPSVLFGLERYKDAGIQGITVGLNDWAQLLLGIDRDHPAFYSLLMQNQAPLKQAIVQLVRQASALNLPSIVCGSIVPQMLESWLEQLIHAGLTGVCVDMESLSSMRQAIARVEARLSTP